MITWEQTLEDCRRRIAALEARGVEVAGARRQLDYAENHLARLTVPPAALLRVGGGRPSFRLRWQSTIARAELTLSPAGRQARYTRYDLKYWPNRKRPMMWRAVDRRFDLPALLAEVSGDMLKHGWLQREKQQ